MPIITNNLFPIPKQQRAKRLFRMSLTDGGYADNLHMIACFECRRCGHKVDWAHVKNFTECRRGIPCSICNKD